MKKYLLIFLSVFSLFFITDTVNATSDYMFTTAEVINNGSSYFTGSRNPGNPGAETNFTYFSFGYYNLSTTFQPGQKWRITADYCTNDNNYLNNYREIGHSGISNYSLTFKKGGSCIYTSSSGVVSLGDLVSFVFDFEIDVVDYTTGWVKYEFFLPTANWHWVSFKDYRIYSSSEITDNDNTNSIIDNSNKNQQQTNEKLDEAENTRKGILGTLRSVADTILGLPKKIVDLLFDSLKSLFIPNNMDFINNFVNSIESKLGFIAEIPISIINFMLNLANATWEDITSISFPTIDIFGYKFWNAQEIDISEGLKIFKPFKYITDCLCVILLSRGLLNCWENFTGGGKE